MNVCIKHVYMYILKMYVLKHQMYQNMKNVFNHVLKYSQFRAKLFFQEGKLIRINCMLFSKRQKSNGKKESL